MQQLCSMNLIHDRLFGVTSFQLEVWKIADDVTPLLPLHTAGVSLCHIYKDMRILSIKEGSGRNSLLPLWENFSDPVITK
jgi:hypothetical protein